MGTRAEKMHVRACLPTSPTGWGGAAPRSSSSQEPGLGSRFQISTRDSRPLPLPDGAGGLQSHWEPRGRSPMSWGCRIRMTFRRLNVQTHSSSGDPRQSPTESKPHPTARNPSVLWSGASTGSWVRLVRRAGHAVGLMHWALWADRHPGWSPRRGLRSPAWDVCVCQIFLLSWHLRSLRPVLKPHVLIVPLLTGAVFFYFNSF